MIARSKSLVDEGEGIFTDVDLGKVIPGLEQLGLITTRMKRGVEYGIKASPETLEKLKLLHKALHGEGNSVQELQDQFPELYDHFRVIRMRMDQEELETLVANDLNLDEATKAMKMDELAASWETRRGAEAYFYRGWKAPAWIEILEEYMIKHNISPKLQADLIAGTADDYLMQKHSKKIRAWDAKAGVPKAEQAMESPIDLMRRLEPFQRSRVDATFETMVDTGFEPLFWNPYEQLRTRVMQGQRHRIYNAYINFLLKQNLAVKGADWRPDLHYFYRVPALGKLWEGPASEIDPRRIEGAMHPDVMRADIKHTQELNNAIFVRPDIADNLEVEFGIMSVGGTLVEEFGEAGVRRQARLRSIGRNRKEQMEFIRELLAYQPPRKEKVRRAIGQAVRRGITAEIRTPAPDWFAVRNLRKFNIYRGLNHITTPLKLTKLFGSPFQAFDMLYTSYGPRVLGIIDILAKGTRQRKYQSQRLASIVDHIPESDRVLGVADSIVDSTVDSGRAFKAMLNGKTRDDIADQIFGDEGKVPLTMYSDANPRSLEPGSSGQGIHVYGVWEAGVNIGGSEYWFANLEPAGMLKQLEEISLSQGFRQAPKVAQREFMQVVRAMRDGLFDGVYPQAMISVIKGHKAHQIVQAFPHYTDAQINAKIAHDINQMFRIYPQHYSNFQSPLTRWLLQNLFAFAPGEYEGMARLFASAGRGLVVPIKEGIRGTPLQRAIARIPGPGPRMAAERTDKAKMLDKGGQIALNTIMGQMIYYAILAEFVHFSSTQGVRIASGEGFDPSEGHLPFARFNPVRKRRFGAQSALDIESYIPFEMNPDFLTSDVAFARGRNGTNVQVNFLMNWDFALRALEPNSFISNRQPVLMAAFNNYLSGSNYYGRDNNSFGARTLQFGIDMGVPIQAQHLALGIGRAFDIGAVDERFGPTGRGGVAAPFLNMTGAGMFNVEATREMRDRRASEMFGSGKEARPFRPDLPATRELGGRGASYDDLNLFEKLLVDWAVPIELFGASRYYDLEPYQKGDVDDTLDSEISQRQREQSRLIQEEGVNYWAERLAAEDARDLVFERITSILQGKGDLKDQEGYDPNTRFVMEDLREMHRNAQDTYYAALDVINEKLDYETEDTSPHSGRQALIDYYKIRDNYQGDLTKEQIIRLVTEQKAFMNKLSYDDAFYVTRNTNLGAEDLIKWWGPTETTKRSIWNDILSNNQVVNNTRSIEARAHHILGSVWKRPR